ncbi:hypothetical protein TIFTF001_000987 [Ficus carica]|uniref:Uncharacterized protein n=1 Tax=Ficus carica TaxID=3494 RepID=A0AA87YXU3_FICCA|nr:hypothetical protein TIFTF001_000987 [Ficus carica]
MEVPRFRIPSEDARDFLPLLIKEILGNLTKQFQDAKEDRLQTSVEDFRSDF